MKLMIIESPGKVKKLSAILGSTWKIAASVGHVRDLPLKEMGVIAPDFKPVYELSERGSEVVKRLKNMVKEASEVYLATDPDREGESISWHLKECLGLKDPKRVTFNEITESAVNAAMHKPRAINGKLVAAQEARRVLDRLVGYTVSPELSKQSGQRLSAGRVQSPAVRLVVERERQIKTFKVTNHFGALLVFGGEQWKEAEWNAEWQVKPDFATEESPYFMDREFALRVSQLPSVTVTAYEESEAKRSPPAPFTTSTMQQAASVTLGLNPKGAMDTAQKLYEQGHITYHRTDNPNISEDALPEIRKVADTLGLAMAPATRLWKAPEGAQAGHPAITPTHWEVEEAGETSEQRALYRLIRLRAIACQLADARYAVRVAKLTGQEPQSGKTVHFKGQGRTLIDEGWLRLVATDQTEEGKAAEVPNPVPKLTSGQKLVVTSGRLLEKKTKPPSRYTEASLVKKLESEGIGRPATYASIMENITNRGYVRVEKKYLVPSETGELIVDALIGKFAFIDLGYTREIEADLDKIANGERHYKETVGKLYAQLQGEMSTLSVAAAPKFQCPSCGKALRRLKGSHGYFWGCSGHPACSTVLPDANGKPGQKKQQELSEFNCPTCGKPLVHQKKKAIKGRGGYDFWGCSGFKEGCRQNFKNDHGKPLFSE